MAQLERARLINVTQSKPGKEQAITVLFNPDEYKLSRNNSWTSRGIGKTSKTLEAEFTRLDALDLEVTLYLDNSLVTRPGTTLEAQIEKIIQLTEIPASALKATPGNNAKLHPPIVRFEWGKLNFQGVITKFDLTCTQFSREGYIRRAQVDLSLMQCEAATTGTSPSVSQSTGRSVLQGEDLAQSLVRGGMDPKSYRSAATSGGIANPLKPIL